jgi:hypothetical protein
MFAGDRVPRKYPPGRLVIGHGLAISKRYRITNPYATQEHYQFAKFSTRRS